MRTRNVLLSTITTMINSIVVLLSGLIIPRYIIGQYGSSVNGLVSSITQFISYFNLLEAGMAGAAIFALYKPLAEKNQNQINKILSASKLFYYKIGLIYFVGSLFFSFTYGVLFSDVLSTFGTILLSLSIAVGGVLEFITMSKYRVLLTADQKSYICAIATSISVVVRTVLTIVMIEVGINIALVKLVASFTILIRSMILMTYVRKKYPNISYNEYSGDVVIDQRRDVLLMQILGTVQNAFPIVVMTFFRIDYTLISVYTVYASVISGITMVTEVIINGSIYSSFGEIIQKNDYNTLKRAYGEFETLCCMLFTVLFSCASVLIIPFVKIYTRGVTDIEYIDYILAFLMILNGFFLVVKYPLSSMIQAAGHYRATRWRTVTQFLIGIIAPIVLVPVWGIYGVVIGAILSNVYRTLDVLIYVPKRILKTSYFKHVKRYLICIVSILIVVISTIRFVDFEINNYIVWAIWGIVYAIISLSICGILYTILCNKDIKFLRNRLKFLILKKVK